MSYDLSALLLMSAIDRRQGGFIRSRKPCGVGAALNGARPVIDLNFLDFAYGAMDEGHGAMHTLYGAYKYCDEQIAKVYSQDWNVHSVGIRPGVVYGVGRDQGLTSKTTFAILAAAAGKPYEVPFSGGVSWLYAGEVASAFIHAVSRERKGAPVFDMNGVYAPVEEGLRILRQLAPSAAITSSGQALAFPMHLPDEPLRAQLGDYGNMPLAEGIRETYEAFQSLIRRGLVSMPE